MITIVKPKDLECKWCDDILRVMRNLNIKHRIEESDEEGAFPQLMVDGKSVMFTYTEDRLTLKVDESQCKALNGKYRDEACHIKKI